MEITKKILTQQKYRVANTALWSLKMRKIKYNIKWSILEKLHRKTKIDRCPFFLAEKLYLTEYFDDIRLKNKK